MADRNSGSMPNDAFPMMSFTGLLMPSVRYKELIIQYVVRQNRYNEWVTDVMVFAHPTSRQGEIILMGEKFQTEQDAHLGAVMAGQAHIDRIIAE